MSEQKKQCNCKGAKRIAEVSDYLKRYGEYEDQEHTTKTKWMVWFVNAITIIVVPFLFMYILINAIYNRVVKGKAKVSMDRIYEYIQYKHNNG